MKGIRYIDIPGMMSTLQHMKRHRAGLRSNAGKACVASRCQGCNFQKCINEYEAVSNVEAYATDYPE
ncbi:hypothetical protein EYF80_016931 [Liparis tanakae]|uniref:Uncharacterized protein n=1 Tax=Liparis tanakae TaxID=230148 RepID=A0A4Z2I4R7_9TELE|nr:hypothetical protein EYF80_016931 [Liparis tanakae]